MPPEPRITIDPPADPLDVLLERLARSKDAKVAAWAARLLAGEPAATPAAEQQSDKAEMRGRK